MKTDADFLLDVLKDGGWHSLNEILRRSLDERGCGLTVHSRAATLRARGYHVEHRRTGVRGAGSEYRLLLSEREPGKTEGPGSRVSPSAGGVATSRSLSEQLVLVPARRGAYHGEAA